MEADEHCTDFKNGEIFNKFNEKQNYFNFNIFTEMMIVDLLVSAVFAALAYVDMDLMLGIVKVSDFKEEKKF